MGFLGFSLVFLGFLAFFLVSVGVKIGAKLIGLILGSIGVNLGQFLIGLGVIWVVGWVGLTSKFLDKELIERRRGEDGFSHILAGENDLKRLPRAVPVSAINLATSLDKSLCGGWYN